MKTKYLKTIERYFNGEMDQAEREAFEAGLRDNILMKREFEEYQAIYEAISDREAIELRKQLKDIAAGFAKGEGRNGGWKISGEWQWLAALFIISISVVAVVYFLVNSPLTGQYLAFRQGARTIDNGTYRLDPVYNDLMRYRVRSADFILECPRDSLVVEKKSDVLFRWTSSVEGPFVLEILDRHGKIIFTSSSPLSNPYVFSKNIPIGVYIVRIRTATQALCYRLLYIV